MTLVFRRFHVLLCTFTTLFLDPTVILSTGPVPCSDTCNDGLPLIYNALRYESVRN